MRKKFLFLVCVSSWIVLLFSCQQEVFENEFDPGEPVGQPNRVTPSEAVDIARLYFDSFFPETRNASRSTQDPTIEIFGSSVSTRSADGLDTMLYLLNYDNQGFVLIGADRRMQNEVYAISESGSFHLKDTLQFPEIKNLLGTIEKFVVSDFGMETRVSSSDGKLWYPVEYRQKPVATKWGQRYPFDQYCFTTTGQPAVAGCGPIAISQIMAYHKHPARHTNTRTSQTFNYNWDQLSLVTDSVRGTQYPQYALQLARFIEQAGSESYARYGSTTSTYLSDLMNAMVKMGYEVNPVDGYRGPSYSTELVKEGLISYGPVLVTGQADEGGHAWVVDGYLRAARMFGPGSYPTEPQKEFVRCNWGWGAKADGFYLGGLFDTREGGYIEGNGTKGKYNFYFSLQVVPKIIPAGQTPAPSLKPEWAFNVNSTNSILIDWDQSNKQDYNYEWILPSEISWRTLRSGELCWATTNIPGVYPISVRITGKYNSYDSGILNATVTVVPRPTLPDITLREGEWTAIELNWNIQNKQDYIFDWQPNPFMKYRIINDTKIEVWSILESQNDISVEITGRNSNYRERADSYITYIDNPNDGRAGLGFVVWNDSGYDLNFKMGNTVVSTIPAGGQGIFAEPAPEGTTTIELGIESTGNPAGFRDTFRYSTYLRNAGATLNIDIDNRGFTAIVHTDESWEGDHSLYWEYGDPRP